MKTYLIILIIYVVLALSWGIFSVFKIREFGRLGKLLSNQISVFLLNFFLFPYCFIYAIIHKKI